MDYRKISRLSPDKLLQSYFWDHSKKEWLQLMILNFVPRFKVCVYLLALLSPFVTSSILADGTNSRAFIAHNVRMLATSMPAMEKSFEDIDSLRKSISKVAYQDPGYEREPIW